MAALWYSSLAVSSALHPILTLASARLSSSATYKLCTNESDMCTILYLAQLYFNVQTNHIKMQCLVEMQSVSVGLGWELKFGVSNKLWCWSCWLDHMLCNENIKPGCWEVPVIAPLWVCRSSRAPAEPQSPLQFLSSCWRPVTFAVFPSLCISLCWPRSFLGPR